MNQLTLSVVIPTIGGSGSARSEHSLGLLFRAGTKKWMPAETIWREKFGATIASSWMDESLAFRAFIPQVVLEGPFTAESGLRPAMTEYVDRGRRGYPFPRPLSILPIVAWRLLTLNLWARRYVSTHAEAP